MTAIQLEFDIYKEEDDRRIFILQKQIDEVLESFGKVRRKLFAEVGELKKICSQLQLENIDLRSQVMEMRGDKFNWVYGVNEKLFDTVQI